MIIVDTNIIAYLLIQGERTEGAQKTYRKDPDWMAPRLWQHEFLNVLATFVREGGATAEQVEDVWHGALQLLAPGEQSPDMMHALQLATRHAVSAYDAQYVALAMEHSVPLVTEDRRLLKTFPLTALSIGAFLDS